MNSTSARQKNSIRIFVDADACPVAIKEILFRTAERLQIQLVLVTNLTMYVPRSEWIQLINVSRGANVADDRIVELVEPGDVVITGDIPLASRIVQKSAIAIGTRGELLDDSKVHGRLASRNLAEQFRSAGIDVFGPKPQSAKDVQAFANVLDRTLTRLLNEKRNQRL